MEGREEEEEKVNNTFFSRYVVPKYGSVALKMKVIRGWACSGGSNNARVVTMAAAACLLLRSSVEIVVLYAAHNGIKRSAAYNFLRWW